MPNVFHTLAQELADHHIFTTPEGAKRLFYQFIFHGDTLSHKATITFVINQFIRNHTTRSPS